MTAEKRAPDPYAECSICGTWYYCRRNRGCSLPRGHVFAESPSNSEGAATAPSRKD